MLRRRQALGLLSALAAAPTASLAQAAATAAASGALAPAFPTRHISLWVPWPAAGATDLAMRILGELAGHQLGVRVVIENRAGAGGTLAMPILQQAAPDGYTIAQMPQPVLRAPLMQKLLWDPIRDTTPITQISGVTFGIVVPSASALRSLDDLFAFAKAHPGELTVATNGVGTTPHVVMDELFARRGVSYVHVPYRGTSEQMIAVSSGHVMAGVNSNGFAPFVDLGKLRLLVTFGGQRTRRWPLVPTLQELGHGIVAASPYGLAGPRGMAPAVVQVLHDAFRSAMHHPAHLAELERYDQDLAYLGTADYAAAMRAAYATEKRTVERLGLARAGH